MPNPELGHDRISGNGNVQGGGVFLQSATLLAGRFGFFFGPNDDEISGHLGAGLLAETNASVTTDELRVVDNGGTGVIIEGGFRYQPFPV